MLKKSMKRDQMASSVKRVSVPPKKVSIGHFSKFAIAKQFYVLEKKPSSGRRDYNSTFISHDHFPTLIK